MDNGRAATQKGEQPIPVGKLPERILKRSIVGTIKRTRPEVLLGSAVGEDCAAIELAPDEIFVLSTDPITGTARDIGRLSIIVTMNDLASAGADPIGVLLTVLLAPGTTEEELRAMMAQVNEACGQAGVQVIGGHTEVTDVVRQTVISVTGVGKVRRDRMISTGGATPGMSLIVTKWIGIEGTSIIAKEKRDELLSRFPESIVSAAADLDRFLSVQRDGAIAAEHGAAAMHDVTEGGIYGALWEMAEASGVGLDIDLSLIPIRQETVELCEYFGIDPYRLISSGCMLIAAEQSAAEDMIGALTDVDIPAAVIGYTTAGKDRVVHYDGETRFLEPPAADEFHKVLG